MSETPTPDQPIPELPPAKPKPPEVPRLSRRAALDADIERELEEALGGMDTKALYAEPQRRATPDAPAEGGRKRGKVIAIHGDDVFVDAGGRSQGMLSLAQFPDGPPAIGSDIDIHIEGYDRANGLLILSRLGAAQHVDWSSVAEGVIVEGRVTGTNKGGLEIEINGIRAFMPISHIELFRVEDTNQYVNQRLRCVVTDVNPAEKNLVVSRRALLEKEREEQREKLWGELSEGQIRDGIVRNVRDFGAFVDVGGVDGLLHISEMAWSRVEDAATVVQPGQAVKVVILKIDHEKRKLSLGLKQLQESPWSRVEANYPMNETFTGKVTRVMDFGAFVELEPGIEGLVHVSELSHQRVRRPTDVVKPGQEVQVRVLKVDPGQKRISLSMKAAAPEPTAAQESPGEPEPARKPLPPHKKPLKGGLR